VTERRFASNQGRQDQGMPSRTRRQASGTGRGPPIVAMPVGTGANSIPLGQSHQEERGEEEEKVLLTEGEEREETMSSKELHQLPGQGPEAGPPPSKETE
jgi:hypothetical protein